MNNAESSRKQFGILYRQFLFRVVDLEVLSASAQGDANKLLGRFAALLIVVSAAWGLGPIFIGKNISSAALAPLRISMQQTLVATTMLTVGIFAVLSWDSIFPDRRDVFVLAPLPVRAWTMLFAKISATGTALGLVVVLLHCGAGLTWPFVFAANSQFSTLVRGFAAYWLTMFAAGAFVYCGLLAIQGMAAQALPRRIFLRASGFTQTAAFCLLICVYCLETPVDSLKMLTAPENQRVLSWIPTYWFTGLLARMNGSTYPVMNSLARRAWMGLAIAAFAAAVAYALSYARTMRQIVEEPDIAPGVHGLRWLPRFGGRMQTAVGQFCVRTLARSRQHRLIWSFYLGIGLACTVLMTQDIREEMEIPAVLTHHLWREANAPVLAASIVMMVLAVVGLRVAFAFPQEMRANWIFGVVGIQDSSDVLAAQRSAMALLAVVPVWLIAALICFWLWPWTQAGAHLICLGLLGLMLCDAALYSFRKIPFTCSYLPGKTNISVIIIASAFVFILILEQIVLQEQQALHNTDTAIEMIVLVGLAAAAMRWAAKRARSQEEQLQFEEIDSAVMELGLYRDGVALGSGTEK